MAKVKKPFLKEEQKKVLFPAIAGIILVAGLFYIAERSFSEVNSLKRQLSETLRTEKAILRLQELGIKEQDLLKSFPKLEQKNDLIKEIANWARKEGLEVSEIDPKEELLSGTNFTRLSLAMGGTGDYLSLVRFLKRIDSSEYFILASSLKLAGYDLKARFSRAQKTPNAQQTFIQPFKVTINVFLIT